jgi:twinkle protein
MLAKQLKTHQPCPDCGSSDALTVYDWGTKCFSCNTAKPSQNTQAMTRNFTQVTSKMTNIHDLTYRSVSERSLTRDTCLQYGIGVKDDSYYFPYYDGDDLVAFKKRNTADKKFSIEGEWQRGKLFGQQLFPKGGKYVTITEGEFDAAAAYQMLGSRGAVVSVRIAKRTMNGWTASRISLFALTLMMSAERQLVRLLKSLELKPRYLKDPKTTKTPVISRKKTK